MRVFFPTSEVGKLLLKAKLRFVRTKVQLVKQILQSNNLPTHGSSSKVTKITLGKGIPSILVTITDNYSRDGCLNIEIIGQIMQEYINRYWYNVSLHYSSNDIRPFISLKIIAQYSFSHDKFSNFVL